MAYTLPPPRLPPPESDCALRYERELGWATAAGPPLALLTGLRFDVLDLPVDAGAGVLRRIGRTGPVALAGDRMLMLVAAGSADELPGLLDWLEWGGIALDLTALGAGASMTAPEPPGIARLRIPRISRPEDSHPGVPHPYVSRSETEQGAAVWLRPPEPGREVEPTLPALTHFGDRPGGSGGVPDLVRLVDAAATQCHRARLLRRESPSMESQPLAFS